MISIQISSFNNAIDDLLKALKKAKKENRNLADLSQRAESIRKKLAILKKQFVLLKSDFPKEIYPKVAFEFAKIDPLLENLIKIFPAPYGEMLLLLSEISTLCLSDLDAAVQIESASIHGGKNGKFIPEDIVGDRYFVMKKSIWECNRCFENACYNACAAMLRKICEHLIVEIYETKGLSSKIKDSNGEYLKLKHLIGKISSEMTIKLTKNAKKALPDLKFFGDLGVHNRYAVVRKDDLDRLHNSIRLMIEELYTNL